MRRHVVAAALACGLTGCQILPTLLRRVRVARPAPSGGRSDRRTARATHPQADADPPASAKRACGAVCFVYTEARPRTSVVIEAP